MATIRNLGMIKADPRWEMWGIIWKSTDADDERRQVSQWLKDSKFLRPEDIPVIHPLYMLNITPDWKEKDLTTSLLLNFLDRKQYANTI